MTSLLLLAWLITADDGPPPSRLDQARAILKASKGPDNERDGKSVIKLLLEGRKMDDLSRDELIALATAYNWASHRKEQLQAADLLVKRDPKDTEAQEWKANALYNLAFSKPTSDPLRKQEIVFYDECARVGKEKAYWLLRKAVALCQGSVETRIGLRGVVEPEFVNDKEAYEQSFVALHQAFVADPNLKEGKGAVYFVDFFIDGHFPRLHRERRFQDLLAGKYKGS